MALIECPECKREISDKASSCPGCGYPIISEPSVPGKVIEPVQETVISPPPQEKRMVPGGMLGPFIHWDEFSDTTAAAQGDTRKGPCPYCWKELNTYVTDTTVSCPHCGREIAVIDKRFYKYYSPGFSVPAPKISSARVNATDPNDPAVLVPLFIVAACILGFLFWEHGQMGSSPAPAPPAQTEGPSNAYFYAQDRVKELLKAPATADFPSFSPEFVSGSGRDFKVAAYVDAQNGFGAKLRNHFTCDVHIIDDKHAKVSCSLKN